MREASFPHPSPGQGRSGRQGGAGASSVRAAVPSEADRKPRRQAALQASGLGPAGRAAPLRGSRGEAGEPADRGAHGVARERAGQGAPDSVLWVRRNSRDTRPGPEGGAPGQAGSGVPARGPGEGEGRGRGDPRAGLTSRRDGRASVFRNLDTLKRLMATGTAAGAASRTGRRLSGARTAAATPAASSPTRWRPFAATPRHVPGQSQPAPAHGAPPWASLPRRECRRPHPPTNRREAARRGHAPMPEGWPRGRGGHVRRAVRPRPGAARARLGA